MEQQGMFQLHQREELLIVVDLFRGFYMKLGIEQLLGDINGMYQDLSQILWDGKRLLVLMPFNQVI